MISMAFSLSEVVIGLAVSVAPAFGGFLYGIGGYGLPFYTVGLTILANLPISYFLIVDLTSNYDLIDSYMESDLFICCVR